MLLLPETLSSTSSFPMKILHKFLITIRIMIESLNLTLFSGQNMHNLLACILIKDELLNYNNINL